MSGEQKETIITVITILVKVHRVYLWRKRVKMLIIIGRGQGNVFHIYADTALVICRSDILISDDPWLTFTFYRKIWNTFHQA